MFFKIFTTNKQLQTKQFDLAAAQNQLSKTELYLQTLRCNEGFKNILVDARGLAEELSVQPTFKTEILPTLLEKKKKHFDYEADDDPLVSPQEQFKVNFHLAIFDTAISSLDERLQQTEGVSSTF
ncbi:uncharacterized protein LOC136042205 [Artemia franciscana]|uniref:uncharacterized protein LOC136042205 n=1 Tax=Artemia franciscana TaxID=6661 RepID=UPI0032DA7CEC